LGARYAVLLSHGYSLDMMLDEVSLLLLGFSCMWTLFMVADSLTRSAVLDLSKSSCSDSDCSWMSEIVTYFSHITL
jgi:hypothetical protein